MKRKPNYGLNRAERQRAKDAKRQEKLEAKRERAARRKQQEPDGVKSVPAAEPGE
ncbi:MAG: hypothetical protein IRY94_16235 [Rhodospirillaceae bacterium]|nr:hypothetical protein [Rhodospirillaceae bacterium]